MANSTTQPARSDDDRAALRSSTTVEVRRSVRRRRTVSAYRDGDRTIVLLPARMSRADEQRWVDVMLVRLAAQDRRRGGRAGRGDDELQSRASELSRRFFDATTNPVSVRWVANQGSRWGSCMPVDGTIRLSDRLRVMPSWVIDYVLVHELAHLLEPGHGARFQSLVERYPKAERARGYLLGVTAATGGGVSPADDEEHAGEDVDEVEDDVGDVEGDAAEFEGDDVECDRPGVADAKNSVSTGTSRAAGSPRAATEGEFRGTAGLW